MFPTDCLFFFFLIDDDNDIQNFLLEYYRNPKNIYFLVIQAVSALYYDITECMWFQ